MLWLQTIEIVVLLMSVGILMWDNKTANEPKPLQVRIKNRRHPS